MEEKILLESENLYKDKVGKVVKISITCSVIGFILFFIFDKAFENARDMRRGVELWSEEYFKYEKLCQTYYDIASIFPFICVFSLAVFIVSTIIFLYVRWTKLTVTDRRIYGQTIFGKRVDLPLDSISSVGTRTLLGGLAVATSSGRIVFLGLTNRNDLHECISGLLIRRNEDTIKNVSASSGNTNLDDIMKLKTMLDEGIITQEEFDTKKKQILGL